MIKAGAGKKLPATIGRWKKAAVQGSTDATIFDNGTQSLIVGFLSDATYDAMASNVTKSITKADTGLCGSTSVASNLVCYLKAADGVFTVSADAGDTPLASLVSFSNELSTALGTQ